VLFAPMVDHRQMLAWAWWLRSRPPECSPTVVLMFRFSYFHIKRNTFLSRPEILAKLGFKALEKTATRHRIRIVTDSERLADEYRGMTKLPLEIFPIPHTENISQIKEPNAGISPKGNLRFVFLGDAREEKGFPLLVSAINSLIKQNKMQGIKFIIQCHIGSHHHAPMLRFRRLLEKTEPAGVQVLKDFLEIEAYYRLLRSADIVVLPYSGKKYYARTSGPMAEAFAAGKPVIVTDNTWMSEQLRRFGSGVTFPDGSVAGLSRAIRETCDRYPELSARAQANRSAWIEFHNPGVFFRMLLPDKAF
ncbi:MAG: glycosyltransferase family 4 protein, partial [Candidatus Ratteibacteria bacterium]